MAALELEVKSRLDQIAQNVEENSRALKNRMDNFEARLGAPDVPGRERKDIGGIDGYTTPGNKLIASHKSWIETFRQTRRVRIDIGQFHPQFEQKTLVDSAALGYTTPGALGSTNIGDGIIPGVRRRLTVRDLCRTKDVRDPMMHFIREASFTNSASPQVEGSAKAESAMTLEVESERIRTIAHWLPITRQAWDDLPELRRWVDETLVYGLKLKEETELLSGDALGEHLNGITTQATAYAATYAAAGDTKLDTLRHAILELENADEACTGFVLHPKDVHDIDLIKDENGGANKGAYIVGDPLGGTLTVRTFWGRAVVASRSMTQGMFLAGDFAKAIIGDRMDATVDVSEEHGDFFIENKLAVRCESRLALAVVRPGAFRFGAF